MVKENQRILNLVNIISDGIIIFISFIIAYFLRFYVLDGGFSVFGLDYYIFVSAIITPLFILLYGGLGLYESFRSKKFGDELALVIKGNLIGTLALLTFFFVVKSVDVSRLVIVMFFFINIIGVSSKRAILRKSLKSYRKKGYNLKHVLLIGSGDLARGYIDALNNNKDLGFSIDGYVSDGILDNGLDFKKLGDLKDLENIMANKSFDEVVAALEAEDYKRIPEVINICEKTGTKLSVIPFYTKFMPTKPYIDEIDGIPLINIRRIPLDNMANNIIKRGVDIVGALILILLTSPIMIIAAIGTKLSSPGPIIFKQERVGLNKKIFTMYKFRSMRINAEEKSGWSTDNDPRKTKFGSFIRKFSIDELPQFFNVLFGDMSLVGPRPEIPHFVEQFKETIPLYMVKHQVRPGITGWAQVNGLRGDTSIKKRVEFDVYYIENWAFFFDIKILFLTAFKGFVNGEKIRK